MKERKENIMELNESIPYTPSNRTLYYDKPTQVKFLDFDGEEPYWIGGIAFHDVVICGCCGDTVEISELYERAEECGYGYSPIEALIWIDISEEIKGE